MRFLSRSECAPFFSASHLEIADNGYLANRAQLPENLQRVEGGPPRTERLGYFAEHLIRWLPSNCGRLFFLNEWTTIAGSPLGALRAMRDGLGEGRNVASVPGHYFGPRTWTWDQLGMSEDQMAESEVLVGMLILTMAGQWDGWLAAEGCGDLIEFWEGNVVYYSVNDEKIEKVREILLSLECRTHML
jgi:hypothetical protein